jgi:uncharacterized protein
LYDAQEAYKNASSKFENSTIPNNFPYYYRIEVKNRLALAEEHLEMSEFQYNENRYYTSTSRSFQSLIYSRYVTYSCDFFDSEDDNYFKNLLSEVESYYLYANEDAKNAEVTGFISLQSVGSAQTRASEAKIYLENAKNLYEASNPYTYFDVPEFLYNLAFVVERSNSIGWWIKIGKSFNEIGKLDSDYLENLALEYIEEAQLAVLYSGIILSELGSTSSYLSNAENLLESARDNLEKGYPAASLFEALEATVRANLAIEIIGTEPEDKIDLAKEQAGIKISNSRSQGIEPILAVSYYEYAESLTNKTDYETALINYKFSGMIAGALGFTNISTSTAESRYVGRIDIIRPERTNIFQGFFFVLILCILACIAGIGLGLIFGGLFFGKEKVEKKSIIPKSNEYNIYKEKPPQQPEFSTGDLPRSIKDYYKKNK